MTNGSSQGLFVVVAVVIFGIFVAISYSLFRDQLTPSLASIFQESTSFAQEILVSFKPITKYSGYNSKNIITNNGEISMSVSLSEEDKNPLLPVGLNLDISDVKIPWGYKIIFEYELFVEGSDEYRLSIDFNTHAETGVDWRGNDSFGTTNFGLNINAMFIGESIQGNKWHKVHVWYANDNENNLKKVPLVEKIGLGTSIGIQCKEANDKNVKTMKIRNLQYKVVPI